MGNLTTSGRCLCGKPIGPSGECESCRRRRGAQATAYDASRSVDHEQGSTFGRPSNHLFAGVGVHGQQAGTATAATAPQQPDPVATARSAAFVRCQTAYQQVVGLVVPGPYGNDERAAQARLRAQRLARTIFGEDLNMEQVAEIVSSMRSRLGPGIQTVRGAANDPECGSRAAYVRGLRPPVVLCPAFFGSDPEQQTRTMLHEAAHLAGIGSATLGESYCAYYDCQTSCGGFDSADSWAHFVHCLSGRAPDVPPPITGRPQTP